MWSFRVCLVMLLTMTSWYNNVVYQSVIIRVTYHDDHGTVTRSNHTLLRHTLLYQDDHGTVHMV